ncbi:hypothetical protein D9757_012778 [Collybiopsis confluens]|uniref:Uncharacterized protein n=1 Tax=Collybiopsis confluens TaxID=2823264 RepID=A0A8H5FSV7_9AGAR|nr:hypothetical protein D9757_012778 [Collybiopsis confluens]
MVLFIHNRTSKRLNKIMKELEEYWGWDSQSRAASQISRTALDLVKNFLVQEDQIVLLADGKTGCWARSQNLGSWLELFQFLWKNLKSSLSILSQPDYKDEAGLSRDDHVQFVSLIISCFYCLSPISTYIFCLPFDELKEAFSEAERHSRIRVGSRSSLDRRARVFDDILFPGNKGDPPRVRIVQSVSKLTSWYRAALSLGNHAPTYLSQKKISVDWVSSREIVPFSCSREEAAAVLIEVADSHPNPKAVDDPGVPLRNRCRIRNELLMTLRERAARALL